MMMGNSLSLQGLRAPWKFLCETNGRHVPGHCVHIHMGIVECPGAYRTVCARHAFGSAVNAVMVSDDLAGDSALGEAGYQDQDCAHAVWIRERYSRSGSTTFLRKVRARRRAARECRKGG